MIDPIPTKVVKPISRAVRNYVKEHSVWCIEDVDLDVQFEWETACDHERFYQDVNRYISDLHNYYSQRGDIQNKWSL